MTHDPAMQRLRSTPCGPVGFRTLTECGTKAAGPVQAVGLSYHRQAGRATHRAVRRAYPSALGHPGAGAFDCLSRSEPKGSERTQTGLSRFMEKINPSGLGLGQQGRSVAYFELSGSFDIQRSYLAILDQH